MKDINVFDLLGPIMVGPSSSHTAGAVRLGLMAGKILGINIRRAKIVLHGSFAQTGKGHGTYLALTAGLMGMQPDDERIRNAPALAQEAGIDIEFECRDLGEVHPNSVRFYLTGTDERTVEVQGCSVGGGQIEINEVDEFNVKFTGNYPALIVLYADYPGMIAEITSILAKSYINIAQMKVSREGRGGRALAVIETDQTVTDKDMVSLKKMFRVVKVMFIEKLN